MSTWNGEPPALGPQLPHFYDGVGEHNDGVAGGSAAGGGGAGAEDGSGAGAGASAGASSVAGSGRTSASTLRKKVDLTYRLRSWVQEDHESTLYTCAFCNFPGEYGTFFATAGGPRATVYNCVEGGAISVVQVYQDDDEDYFACAWSIHGATGDPLLAVAGSRGVIKVINCSTQGTHRMLQGHGNAVNELRYHPVDRRLLLSASKDESVRLWDTDNGVCVAIFAGDQGHRDEVLSVDFHMLGHCFVSSGMDNSIKVWALDTERVRTAIADSAEHSGPPSAFKTKSEQFPAYSTRKVHDNYIDCVRWMGNLLVSKSIDSKLVLWCPDVRRAKDAVTVLREYTYSDGAVWFMRGALDGTQSLLSVGSTAGKVYVWRVDAPGWTGPTSSHKPGALSIYPPRSTCIRQTAFNHDGSLLVAVCDDATVWRWDSAGKS